MWIVYVYIFCLLLHFWAFTLTSQSTSSMLVVKKVNIRETHSVSQCSLLYTKWHTVQDIVIILTFLYSLFHIGLPLLRFWVLVIHGRPAVLFILRVQYTCDILLVVLPIHDLHTCTYLFLRSSDSCYVWLWHMFLNLLIELIVVGSFFTHFLILIRNIFTRCYSCIV